MAYLLGNDIRVSIGETLIGGQQNCSISMESETGDTTTKDSGMWSEEEVTGLSWSVDCDGLIAVSDKAIDSLFTAWTSGQLVDVMYGKAGNYLKGKAIIESLSEEAPSKEKCTYAVTLKGVGKLTKDTTTSPAKEDN